MIRSDNIDPNAYSGNGTDTDDCSADFKLLNTATGRPPTGPIIPPETPGAPTELRVHKGGGAWGGAADDLVLYWKAPIWKWEKLVKNIVYYDSDISNGFQYTSYIMFDPNSAGPGLDDWCILTGFLADANNYAFIVHTTGNTVGVNENMTGTNVGYKQNIILDSTMDFVWISIPYHSDYDWASDITDDGFPNDNIISSVRRWNYTTQKYEARAYIFGAWGGDFDIEPGDAILIFVTTAVPSTWKIVGAYDPDLQFELIVNPTTTDFKMISLPYHRTYQNATHITNEFPDGTKIDVVGQYNYTTQRWDTRLYSLIWGWTGDYDIYSSPADAVLFKVTSPASYYWQPQVMAL